MFWRTLPVESRDVHKCIVGIVRKTGFVTMSPPILYNYLLMKFCTVVCDLVYVRFVL